MRYSQFWSPAFDCKIPQSDWPREFWTISQEPEFSQIWNLFKHTAITVIKTFIIDQIQKKLKNWKNYTFWRQKIFWKNLAQSFTTLHRILIPFWVPEKLKSQFQENFQTEGRTDLIHIYDPSGCGQGSYKRISQFRGITVDSKNKIQYNSG